MEDVSIVGLDLAKVVFQIHAAGADGGVFLRRKLLRGQVLAAVHCCDGRLVLPRMNGHARWVSSAMKVACYHLRT